MPCKTSSDVHQSHIIRKGTDIGLLLHWIASTFQLNSPGRLAISLGGHVPLSTIQRHVHSIPTCESKFLRSISRIWPTVSTHRSWHFDWTLLCTPVFCFTLVQSDCFYDDLDKVGYDVQLKFDTLLCTCPLHYYYCWTKSRIRLMFTNHYVGYFIYPDRIRCDVAIHDLLPWSQNRPYVCGLYMISFQYLRGSIQVWLVLSWFYIKSILLSGTHGEQNISLHDPPRSAPTTKAIYGWYPAILVYISIKYHISMSCRRHTDLNNWIVTHMPQSIYLATLN